MRTHLRADRHKAGTPAGASVLVIVIDRATRWGADGDETGGATDVPGLRTDIGARVLGRLRPAHGECVSPAEPQHASLDRCGHGPVRRIAPSRIRLQLP